MTKVEFNFNEKRQVVSVNRWQKYGKDRIYVQDGGRKLGFYNVETESWELNANNISDGWIDEMKKAVISTLTTPEKPAPKFSIGWYVDYLEKEERRG